VLRRLSFRTGGESHGPQVTALLEGLPRGLELDVEAIDAALRRRQGGAGRGGRQRIESDRVEIVGGVRRGRTIGSPLVLVVRNRDDSIDALPEPTRPRPGHVDLAAAYRYGDLDIRGSLERASARETAGRVAAGAVAAQLLGAVGCEVFGFVRRVGGAVLPDDRPSGGPWGAEDVARLRQIRDASRLYTLDPVVDEAMRAEVAAAGAAGDTVGGVVEVRARGVLPGLGSHLQWSERLDALLGAAILSIPAFKGVEIGLGFASGARRGSEVHDPILPMADGDAVDALPRASNHSASGPSPT
jgi:chorismate synthase